jgi:hypothetical protein
MNQPSAFLTAFWTGLASPMALFGATPLYAPAVLGFTIGSTFASVGASLNRFPATATTEAIDERRAATRSSPEGTDSAPA